MVKDPKLRPAPKRHGPCVRNRFSSPEVGDSRSELSSPFTVPAPRAPLKPHRAGRSPLVAAAFWAATSDGSAPVWASADNGQPASATTTTRALVVNAPGI